MGRAVRLLIVGCAIASAMGRDSGVRADETTPNASSIMKWFAALDDLESPAAEAALAEFVKYRRLQPGLQFDRVLITKFRQGLGAASPLTRRHSIALLRKPHCAWFDAEEFDAVVNQIAELLADDDLEVRREATRYFDGKEDWLSRF